MHGQTDCPFVSIQVLKLWASLQSMLDSVGDLVQKYPWIETIVEDSNVLQVEK